jgi:hypothetical protein
MFIDMYSNECAGEKDDDIEAFVDWISEWRDCDGLTHSGAEELRERLRQFKRTIPLGPVTWPLLPPVAPR